MTAADRRADARTWAGYRSARVNPRTGTLVVVYDQTAGWTDDEGDNRWATLCDDHGGLLTHSTLRLAEYHAATPDEWCDECRGDA